MLLLRENIKLLNEYEYMIIYNLLLIMLLMTYFNYIIFNIQLQVAPLSCLYKYNVHLSNMDINKLNIYTNGCFYVIIYNNYVGEHNKVLD